MNANEIVGALRCCNRSKGHRCSECPVFSRYEHRICKATVDRFAADLIESLQAQLAASQRRERAAVEEIYKIAACDACKHYDPDENDCAKPMVDSHRCFEWHGPMAGEGEE